METRIKICIAALAAVTVFSCQKENAEFASVENPDVETFKDAEPNPDFVPTKTMTFVGVTDDEINPETKTSLDGTSVKWGVSEGIYVFDGVAPRAFTSDNDPVASTVNFEASNVE